MRKEDKEGDHCRLVSWRCGAVCRRSIPLPHIPRSASPYRCRRHRARSNASQHASLPAVCDLPVAQLERYIEQEQAKTRSNRWVKKKRRGGVQEGGRLTLRSSRAAGARSAPSNNAKDTARTTHIQQARQPQEARRPGARRSNGGEGTGDLLSQSAETPSHHPSAGTDGLSEDGSEQQRRKKEQIQVKEEEC